MYLCIRTYILHNSRIFYIPLIVVLFIPWQPMLFVHSRYVIVGRQPGSKSNRCRSVIQFSSLHARTRNALAYMPLRLERTQNIHDNNSGI